MGSVYTASQLLTLRPVRAPLPSSRVASPAKQATYFHIFRKYQSLLAGGPTLRREPEPKRILKYDYVLSNKEYKRRWVQTHGTSAGLKGQPRHEVFVTTIRINWIEYWFRQVAKLERLLAKLSGSQTYVASVARATKVWSDVKSPCAGQKPVYVPPHKRRAEKQESKLATKLQVVGDERFFRVIGGMTYTYDAYKPPPNPRWTKYWYFYRKHGRWRPSEHHPYGDEAPT